MIGLTELSLVIACLACLFGLFALLFSRTRYTSSRLSKRIRSLELTQVEHADAIDSLYRSHKKIYARWSSRAARKNEPNGEMSDEEWKKSTNRQLGMKL